MSRDVYGREDNQVVKAFFNLDTPRDIAELLGFDPAFLRYLLYVMPEEERYVQFEIPKRTGGARKISTPILPLKEVQRSLNLVLQAVYEPKPAVHGFTDARSIVSNAKVHTGRSFVFNIDLQDFFPSINFGRVRGMFMAHPYNCNPSVATVLAQICCWNNELPQGAPTSPIVSNMLCARLDDQLQRLALEQEWTYTRYADDLTFSTSEAPWTTDMVYLQDRHKNPRPVALANDIQERKQLRAHPGDKLHRIIQKNGFEINQKKVRLQVNWQRQEVTGLITNQFPNVPRSYVRQLRAMLHAWEKYGHEAAETEHFRRYATRHHHPLKPRPTFKQVVLGKVQFLGMVRGKRDKLYVRYWNQLVRLAPEFGSPIAPPEAEQKGDVIIHTEGKTDWKHLKAALNALQKSGHFRGLQIEFDVREDATGENELLRRCQTLADAAFQQVPHIHIFDRDNSAIVAKVEPKGSGRFRDWGNNVYSFAIPTPEHRKETPEVSIELYYTDEEIKRQNGEGHRLFLSNEFHEDSGLHLSGEPFMCRDLNIHNGPQPKIVDRKVYNTDLKNNKNVALSKNAFADHILGGEPAFDDFDFTAFLSIFRLVQEIKADSTKDLQE